MNDNRWHCTRTLKPGAAGTKKELKKYGDKLVAVRYWENAQGQKRKTVELIES